MRAHFLGALALLAFLLICAGLVAISAFRSI